MKINDRDIPWLTLDALLCDKAARHGEAPFAEVAGQHITYAELEARSRKVACGLLGSGLTRGDRVASFMTNDLAQLLVWFGSVRAGLIWVPLNAGLVGNDLVYTLRNSGSTVLVADDEGVAKFQRVKDDLQSVKIYTTGEAGEGVLPIAALEQFPDGPLPATAAADPGAVLYTGGTTGFPKGVVLPQFSFILAGIRYGETFSVSPGEKHLTTMPLFHAGALQWGVMGPLVNDMTTVVEKQFSASRYFDRLRETRANVIDPFGVVLTMLCNQPKSELDRQHDVRVAIGATHGLAPHIPSEFSERFGIPLIRLYGLTEGGGAMLTADRSSRSTANGKAHGWVEIRVADSAGMPVDPGEIGQVLLRPTFPLMFMSGYYLDPERTAEVCNDYWLRTGDLGCLDADGEFRFVGREAQWLRRRGENISAVEVETILSDCPAVRDVAVVAVPSEVGEDDVKAFIVVDLPGAQAAKQIWDWSADHMAAFKVPRYIEFIDTLPRSTTKMEIDRSGLRKRPNIDAFDRKTLDASKGASNGRPA